MSFSAFVKYKNAQYFKVSQHTKGKVSFEEFNKLLYGYINNAKTGKNTTINDKSGTFIYMKVNSVERYNAVKSIVRGNKDLYIKNAELESAKKQFLKSFNNLDFDGCVSNNDCNVIFYGFRNNDKYLVCENTGFLLVNKYGLVCESFNEVIMYNYIYSYLIENRLDMKYIFYKPVNPENDYSNPNYISDGVLQKREGNYKIIIEVFGRNEEDYVKRKNEKIKSCKDKLLYWDVYDKNSFNCFKYKLSELLS